MSDQTTTQNFHEAPCSLNFRYVSKEGFQCQLTLRGVNGSEVLSKAQSAVDWLLENGCLPYGNGYKPNNTNPSNGNGDTNHICPIHGVPMQLWEKNGRTWRSHKTADGNWCSGKKKGQ